MSSPSRCSFDWAFSGVSSSRVVASPRRRRCPGRSAAGTARLRGRRGPRAGPRAGRDRAALLTRRGRELRGDARRLDRARGQVPERRQDLQDRDGVLLGLPARDPLPLLDPQDGRQEHAPVPRDLHEGGVVADLHRPRSKTPVSSRNTPRPGRSGIMTVIRVTSLHACGGFSFARSARSSASRATSSGSSGLAACGHWHGPSLICSCWESQRALAAALAPHLVPLGDDLIAGRDGDADLGLRGDDLELALPRRGPRRRTVRRWPAAVVREAVVNLKVSSRAGRVLPVSLPSLMTATCWPIRMPADLLAAAAECPGLPCHAAFASLGGLAGEVQAVVGEHDPDDVERSSRRCP